MPPTGRARIRWFLPFNLGWNHGAGNPPNPFGLKTDYLWKEVLTRPRLADILENYAQVVEVKDANGRVKRRQVFPRYHQLDVVRKLLADAGAKGAGASYLIQHSAGSGKSNSITWLAHQLVELKKDGQPVFDSIIVVTDRTVLDKQIRDNIKQFAQVSAVVGAVTQGSGQLRGFIEQGKKIIISTIQKFPFIVEEIGDQHRDRRFAIIIDEAHSSQGGRTTSAMHAALGQDGGDEDETDEDRINRVMESRKKLKNASYFAFTATPKNKTLEIFGLPQPDGTFRPFHTYTMKQAIEEKFILDVLQNYTPVSSYYRLMKKVEEDPEFDVKKAQTQAQEVRRVPRPRDPPEGGDHGGPLPRPGHRETEDRWQGQGHGRLQRHRTGHAVQAGLRCLPRRTQEPIPGHRGVLRGARGGRPEGHGSAP